MGNWRYLVWLSRRRIAICTGLAAAGAAIQPAIGLPGLSDPDFVVFTALALVASAAHAVFLPRGEIEAPVLALMAAMSIPAWQIGTDWMTALTLHDPDKELAAALTILILAPISAILLFVALIWLYVNAADRIVRMWTIRWRLDVGVPIDEVRAALFLPEVEDHDLSNGRFSNHDGTEHVASLPITARVIEETGRYQKVAVSIDGDPGPTAIEATRLSDLGGRTRIESETRLRLSLLARLSFLMEDGPQDRTLCKIADHLGTPALPFHEYPDRSLLTFLATCLNPVAAEAEDRR